ncbi:MAG TPA: protoglobin domain-containing protein [Polyangiaceae bacterium]|jgi:rsbT co-antagonist protein RsbR|nr:protoglobin domain-containing protein [Polyangiaceae bacterium]
MADLADRTPSRLLSKEMGLTEQAVERRRRIVGLEARDLERIASIRGLITPRVDEYTSAFFNYLASLDEGRAALANRSVAERARQLKREHLVAMVQGDYGTEYVAQRLELAVLYSKAGLDLRVFLAAFHHLLETIGLTVMKHFEHAPLDGFGAFMSLEKLAFFDIGIIVDVMVFERERVIRQQQDSIRELSTPVLQIRERLLLLPIIGIIDTHRARLITESLLKAIRANRAKVVVMDITGVATIDSKVANHLIQTVTAAKLMGATVIVTGLSAEVAQSLVVLGIDLAKLNTVGDLQGGIEEAEQLLGYQVTRVGDHLGRSPSTEW